MIFIGVALISYSAIQLTRESRLLFNVILDGAKDISTKSD
jgi:hypothetical protein